MTEGTAAGPTSSPQRELSSGGDTSQSWGRLGVGPARAAGEGAPRMSPVSLVSPAEPRERGGVRELPAGGGAAG